MPFCEVGKYQKGVDATSSNNGTKIFYRTYGQGPVKVLLIIGLAGTHSSWDPQIKALAGTITPNDSESPTGDRSFGEDGGMEVCAFDNRGMGLSSVPTKKSEYTTSIMAKDAIAIMDHLGWEKAHVFGHSMGAMIACKLAAMVPERVLSLALLNVTGGGYECIPRRSGNLAYVISGLEQNTSGGIHVDALLLVYTLEVVFRSEFWCNGALRLELAYPCQNLEFPTPKQFNRYLILFCGWYLFIPEMRNVIKL